MATQRNDFLLSSPSSLAKASFLTTIETDLTTEGWTVDTTGGGVYDSIWRTGNQTTADYTGVRVGVNFDAAGTGNYLEIVPLGTTGTTAVDRVHRLYYEETPSTVAVRCAWTIESDYFHIAMGTQKSRMLVGAVTNWDPELTTPGTGAYLYAIKANVAYYLGQLNSVTSDTAATLRKNSLFTATVAGAYKLAKKGTGTISTLTTDKTVTGTLSNFDPEVKEITDEGHTVRIRRLTGELIGTVDTITNDTGLELLANAAVEVTDEEYLIELDFGEVSATLDNTLNIMTVGQLQNQLYFGDPDPVYSALTQLTGTAVLYTGDGNLYGSATDFANQLIDNDVLYQYSNAAAPVAGDLIGTLNGTPTLTDEAVLDAAPATDFDTVDYCKHLAGTAFVVSKSGANYLVTGTGTVFDTVLPVAGADYEIWGVRAGNSDWEEIGFTTSIDTPTQVKIDDGSGGVPPSFAATTANIKCNPGLAKIYGDGTAFLTEVVGTPDIYEYKAGSAPVVGDKIGAVSAIVGDAEITLGAVPTVDRLELTPLCKSITGTASTFEILDRKLYGTLTAFDTELANTVVIYEHDPLAAPVAGDIIGTITTAPGAIAATEAYLVVPPATDVTAVSASKEATGTAHTFDTNVGTYRLRGTGSAYDTELLDNLVMYGVRAVSSDWELVGTIAGAPADATTAVIDNGAAARPQGFPQLTGTYVLNPASTNLHGVGTAFDAKIGGTPDVYEYKLASAPVAGDLIGTVSSITDADDIVLAAAPSKDFDGVTFCVTIPGVTGPFTTDAPGTTLTATAGTFNPDILIAAGGDVDLWGENIVGGVWEKVGTSARLVGEVGNSMTIAGGTSSQTYISLYAVPAGTVTAWSGLHVYGAATSFDTEVEVGEKIYIADALTLAGTVASVDSASGITLAAPYAGAAQTPAADGFVAHNYTDVYAVLTGTVSTTRTSGTGNLLTATAGALSTQLPSGMVIWGKQGATWQLVGTSAKNGSDTATSLSITGGVTGTHDAIYGLLTGTGEAWTGLKVYGAASLVTDVVAGEKIYKSDKTLIGTVASLGTTDVTLTVANTTVTQDALAGGWVAHNYSDAYAVLTGQVSAGAGYVIEGTGTDFSTAGGGGEVLRGCRIWGKDFKECTGTLGTFVVNGAGTLLTATASEFTTEFPLTPTTYEIWGEDSSTHVWTHLGDSDRASTDTDISMTITSGIAGTYDHVYALVPDSKVLLGVVRTVTDDTHLTLTSAFPGSSYAYADDIWVDKQIDKDLILGSTSSAYSDSRGYVRGKIVTGETGTIKLNQFDNMSITYFGSALGSQNSLLALFNTYEKGVGKSSFAAKWEETSRIFERYHGQVKGIMVSSHYGGPRGMLSWLYATDGHGFAGETDPYTERTMYLRDPATLAWNETLAYNFRVSGYSGYTNSELVDRVLRKRNSYFMMPKLIP